MSSEFRWCPMRKLLSALAVSAALAPAGFSQQERLELNYEIATDIPQACEVAAILEDGEIVALGASGAVNAFNPVETPEVVVADLVARCNAGQAAITIDTQNSFTLLNGAGGPNQEIPFTLAVDGTSISGGISAASTYTDSPTSTGRRMTLSVGDIDPLALVAGNYTDTIIISIAPAA